MSNTNKPSVNNPSKATEKTSKPWFVYFLRCADNSLYAGVTTCLERRVKEHNGNSKSAAKYTRVRQPVKLVYFEQVANRVEATKREYQIRKLSKPQKEAMIASFTVST